MADEIRKVRGLRTIVLSGILFAAAPPSTQGAPAPQDARSIDELAARVAGRDGNSLDRTRRLVRWINTGFEWTATDYQQRTAEQIIERRGGNCAELSRVLARLLSPAGIRYRWVAEINIHPDSPRRERTAAEMVAQKGNSLSVFGRRHNDHRWLEVFDESTGQWAPADPSIGVVGVRSWIEFRLGLDTRPQPAVPAVAEIVRDMIAPFAVAVIGKGDTPSENRSEYYLIEQFDQAYGGQLRSLPAWKEWTSGIRSLSRAAIEAFEGRTNLHDRNRDIARLAEVYAALRVQAKEKGVTFLSTGRGDEHDRLFAEAIQGAPGPDVQSSVRDGGGGEHLVVERIDSQLLPFTPGFDH